MIFEEVLLAHCKKHFSAQYNIVNMFNEFNILADKNVIMLSEVSYKNPTTYILFPKTKVFFGLFFFFTKLEPKWKGRQLDPSEIRTIAAELDMEFNIRLISSNNLLLESHSYDLGEDITEWLLFHSERFLS